MDVYEKQYNEYAKEKATYYYYGKFEPQTSWGFRNLLRENLIIDLIRELYESNNQLNILDLGCASGHTALKIAELFPKSKVVGFDIAKAFIEFAKSMSSQKRITNVDFRVVNAHNWNEKEKYDLIIGAEIIEHVDSASEFLKSVFQALKPGGQLILTTPCLNGDGTIWGRLMRLLRIRKFIPATNFTNEDISEHGDQHVREYSVKLLLADIEKSGFEAKILVGQIYFDGPFWDKLNNKLLLFKPYQLILSSLESKMSKLFKIKRTTFSKQLIAMVSRNE